MFGGTFDPVHNGHVAVASDVRDVLCLDRVLLVVASDPWQKRGSVIASAEARYELVLAALDGVDGVEASRVELDHGGPSVTADTLEALQRPGRELFLLLGADAVANMPTWRRLEETRDLATLAIIGRAGEGSLPPGPGWRVEHVDAPRLDISSTELRARIAAGRPIDGLVPPAVVRAIHARGLYAAR